MNLRSLLLTLAFTTSVVAPLFASHESGNYVPIRKDKTGESALDMYAKRTQVLFRVLDCSPDQLLWNTSKTVAAIWNGVAPVKIELELDAESCTSGRFGNSISEIYWNQTSITDRPNTGDYFFDYFSETRVITEEDIVPNLPLMVSQSVKLSTSTTIVLYNSMMQSFGNALGLGNAYEIYPTQCHWSVMLANCTKQRLPPQEADLAAIRHIYSMPLYTGLRPSDFDTNQNGKIDIEEFEYVIDEWTLGKIDDALFIQIFGFWVEQTIIPNAASTPITQASVTILDLNGKVVLERECASHKPDRLQRMLSLISIPSGVYIAVIRDCNSWRAEIKMIAKIETGH